MTTSTDRLTIVSGVPRSGTSMMMRMLEKGGLPALVDGVREADEDNPRGYYEFEPVKKTRHDPSWLERAPGHVVKMVHLLLLDLPEDRNYAVIFMRRSLEEVVRSQNAMLQRSGKNRDDDLDDKRVIEVFRAQLDQVGEFLEASGNFNVLYVNYNDLMHSSAEPIHKVNQFLGNTLDENAMRCVVDPKLYRQRK